MFSPVEYFLAHLQRLNVSTGLKFNQRTVWHELTDEEKLKI